MWAESKRGARAVRRIEALIRRRLLCSRNWWAQIQPGKIGLLDDYPSERSIWRAIQALRLDPACGIEFCVYWRREGRSRRTRKISKGRWVLIAALSERLKFDRMPLFLHCKGGPERHTRRHHRLAVAEWMAQDSPKKKSESAKTTPPSTPSGVFTDSAAKDNSPTGPERAPPPRPGSNKSSNGRTTVVKKEWKGALQRMTLWLISELYRVQTGSGVKVRWHRRHAYTFTREALHKGYDRAVIIKTWVRACEMTYADNSDQILRIEPALLLAHARRLLRDLDSFSDSDRISQLYRRRNFYPSHYKKGPDRHEGMVKIQKGFSKLVFPVKFKQSDSDGLDDWVKESRAAIERTQNQAVIYQQLNNQNEVERKRRFVMEQVSENYCWSQKLSDPRAEKTTMKKIKIEIPGEPTVNVVTDWEKKVKMEQEAEHNRNLAAKLAAEIKDTDLSIKDVQGKPKPVPIADPKVRMALESQRNRELANELMKNEEEEKPKKTKFVNRLIGETD